MGRLVRRKLGVLSAVATTGVICLTGIGASTTTATPARPLLGVVQADFQSLPALKASGFGAVTIQVGWNDAESADGTFNAGYGASLAQEAEAARADGMQVVLDPGIQFPPDWVLSLNDSARFTDQYGDRLAAATASGQSAANAVTDPEVRAALGGYLSWLGRQFPRGVLSAVRQGGGPTGELRYPGGAYAGHTDAWWAYDPASQARSPVPGWRPGTGTPAQAQRFLAWYDQNLNGYGVWLGQQLSTAFGATMRRYLMLPGWGDRPGETAAVADRLLVNAPDEVHLGLDWASLFAQIPDPMHTTLYSTWVDAPSNGADSTREDPPDFVASIRGQRGFTLGGENTGGEDSTQIQLMVDRAAALHYSVLFWFGSTQLVAPAPRDSTSTRPPSFLPTWDQAVNRAFN